MARAKTVQTLLRTTTSHPTCTFTTSQVEGKSIGFFFPFREREREYVSSSSDGCDLNRDTSIDDALRKLDEIIALPEEARTRKALVIVSTILTWARTPKPTGAGNISTADRDNEYATHT